MSWWSWFVKPKPKPDPNCGVAVIVHEGTNTGPGVPGLSVAVEWGTAQHVGVTNADGYVAFASVPKQTTVVLSIQGPGWQPYEGSYTFQAQNQDVPIAVQRDLAIAPIAPRTYQGNMCGVRVAGLTHNVAGGRFADQVLSWFYDRYTPEEQALIRADWSAKGYLDVLLSWPDSRAAGFSEADFVATCRGLVSHGFRPNVMLLSKEYDPHDDFDGCLANVNRVLDQLLTPRACSRIGIAWEASLWMSPSIHQRLIDAIAPRCVAAGVKVYVHFQEGYGSYQEPGEFVHHFWDRNVGKLTGLYHQRILRQTKAQYRSDSGGIQDMLDRFAGQFGMPADSGFGHPFDFIALEITAMDQFNGNETEAGGNEWGRWALETPPSVGPAGSVGVMGSGNGQ